MKTLTPAFALMQGAVWAACGSIYGYSSVYLLSCGLSNTAIGLLLGGTIGLCFLCQMLAGEALNRRGRRALRTFLTGCALCMAGLCLLLFFLPPGGASVPLFLAVCLLIQLLPAIINSAGMYEVQLEAALNIGVGRGAGSLGYAVCTVAVGRLLETGLKGMFAAGILLSAALAAGSLWFYRRAALRPEDTPAPAPKGGADPRFLQSYPRYAFFLTGVVLVMLGHTFVSNYLYQIVDFKGGDELDTGIAGAVAAVSELPALFAFSWLIRRRWCGLWLKLSGGVLLVKLLATLWAPSVPGVWASELLQAGYGLLTISGIYYAGQAVPHRDAIGAQAYLGAASTLGMFFSLLLGGAVIDRLGVPSLLLAGALSAGAGLLILCRTVRRPREGQGGSAERFTYQEG